MDQQNRFLAPLKLIITFSALSLLLTACSGGSSSSSGGGTVTGVSTPSKVSVVNTN